MWLHLSFETLNMYIYFGLRGHRHIAFWKLYSCSLCGSKQRILAPLSWNWVFFSENKLTNLTSRGNQASVEVQRESANHNYRTWKGNLPRQANWCYMINTKLKNQLVRFMISPDFGGLICHKSAAGNTKIPCPASVLMFHNSTTSPFLMWFSKKSFDMTESVFFLYIYFFKE